MSNTTKPVATAVLFAVLTFAGLFALNAATVSTPPPPPHAYLIIDHPDVVKRYANGAIETWSRNGSVWTRYSFVAVDVRELQPGEIMLVCWTREAAIGTAWGADGVWRHGDLSVVAVPSHAMPERGIAEWVTVRGLSRTGPPIVPLSRIDQLPTMTWAELNGRR